MTNLDARMRDAGFEPVEYESPMGPRIRRVAGRWVVVAWTCEGYENCLPSEPTLEAALSAWEAFRVQPDNDVGW